MAMLGNEDGQGFYLSLHFSMNAESSPHSPYFYTQTVRSLWQGLHFYDVQNAVKTDHNFLGDA